MVHIIYKDLFKVCNYINIVLTLYMRMNTFHK